MSRKVTTQDFIIGAKAVHGTRYDYSKSFYTKRREKVTIICAIHGEFSQLADGHLCGQGCPACGRASTEAAHCLTTADFTSKSRLLHGDKYDYSKSCYTKANSPIVIICPTHGEFRQRAADHYFKGHGCPACGNSQKGSNQILQPDDFIEKATLVHGARYDYSQTVYERSHAKVTIVCRKHGPFSIAPPQHLAGSGCYACSKLAAGGKLRKGQNAFLEQVQEVHGGRYDYSQAVYSGALRKVTIICDLHGPFQQAPVYHLSGQGCPRCATNRISIGWRRSGFVKVAQGRTACLYILHCTGPGEEFYKVGITTRSVAQRYSKTNAMPYKYTVLLLCQSEDAGAIWDLEKQLNKQFRSLKYKPALGFDGQTECFSDITPILSELPEGTIFYTDSQQAA